MYMYMYMYIMYCTLLMYVYMYIMYCTLLMYVYMYIYFILNSSDVICFGTSLLSTNLSNSVNSRISASSSLELLISTFSFSPLSSLLLLLLLFLLSHFHWQRRRSQVSWRSYGGKRREFPRLSSSSYP